MQVVLDVLSPAERVALVLHDAFGYQFDEISAAVGQYMGTDALYDGVDAVAARFNGVKGAAPITIDGELGRTDMP